MIRLALVGLGKMGLSHLSIVNSHPQVELVAVCDSAAYILDVLGTHAGLAGYTDYRRLLDEQRPDAVLIATPPRSHVAMVRAALERGIHVYCEKPFCMDAAEGLRLAELAERKGLVNQVGYHNRFVATFQEMKRLVDAGIVGAIHHLRAEANGPVVVRPSGSTWRGSKAEGGGCLYDYASHAIDLVNHLVGRPEAVAGTALQRVFSHDVEDEVCSTFLYADGKTAQLAANWSDDSFRKMSLKVSAWGSRGRIAADRQEIHVYLSQPSPHTPELVPGWTVRSTTELTRPVWFYLRGEEYSAQIAHFIEAVTDGSAGAACTFRAAADVAAVSEMMLNDARASPLQEAHLRPARRAQPARSFLPWS
jgi:predicted dehydrogenase